MFNFSKLIFAEAVPRQQLIHAWVLVHSPPYHLEWTPAWPCGLQARFLNILAVFVCCSQLNNQRCNLTTCKRYIVLPYWPLIDSSTQLHCMLNISLKWKLIAKIEYFLKLNFGRIGAPLVTQHSTWRFKLHLSLIAHVSRSFLTF